MKEIFLSVISYRDRELINTLKSAIKNAQQPDKIHFGIVFQDTTKERPDFSFLPNYSLISMHPRDARGAGYARSKAMSLYNNEAYYMQVDSHTQFVKDWDRKCVSQLEKAQGLTTNKAIISYYPTAYHYQNHQIYFSTKPTDQFPAYPTRQFIKLRKSGEWGAERVEFVDPNRSLPELSQTVLAGFVFTYGSIVNDVPYDPEISFFGEELCFAARAWTRGYDIYSPTDDLVYHFYGRGDHPKIWNDDAIRKISWQEIQSMSYEKQKLVLCGIEKGPYGLGNKRNIKQYEDFVGIDFKAFYGVE